MLCTCELIVYYCPMHTFPLCPRRLSRLSTPPPTRGTVSSTCPRPRPHACMAGQLLGKHQRVVRLAQHRSNSNSVRRSSTRSLDLRSWGRRCQCTLCRPGNARCAQVVVFYGTIRSYGHVRQCTKQNH